MKKKLLIPLSTLITTIIPITVVSCGNTSNQNKTNFQIFEVINDSKDISEGVVDVIEKHFNAYINEFTEAQALKAIHLFDASNSPFQDEGDYVFGSNELVLNTSHMAKYTNFTEDDQANYIMQLLAHEYNHYIDHSYLMNIDPNSEVVDKSIHDWNNNGEVQPWPKIFLDEFKNILNYNKSTELYSDEDVVDGFKSIGSIYNQKDLFEMANGIQNPSTLFKELNGNEVMAPTNPIVAVDETRVITKESLSYLYSMDELFARKMQIATSKYFRSTNFDEDGYFKLPLSFIKSKWESPYLQDVVNYQRGLNNFEDNGQYLFDKPTSELLTLYDKVRGVEFDPISFMEIKNDMHIKSDGSFEGDVDRSVIRFGGAINDDLNNKLEYIGYLYNNEFVNIPINIIDRTDANFAKRSYLSDFIDADTIIGKQLYFAEDATGKNKIEIKETRDIAYGKVSTRRYLDEINVKNYAFSKNAILEVV